MKKSIVLSLLVLTALGLARPAPAQTVDEIRAKMIDAMGGRKALEAIKDTTTVANMEMPSMGISGTMTMVQKEPDKMRMDMEFMGMKMTQAYDGKTAWATNPQTGQASEMPEKSAKLFKAQALGNDALLNPAKYGIVYTLKEKAKVDDHNCLVIEQKLADDTKTTIYVDAATYLVYKTKSIGLNQAEVETETETVQTDYRKVGSLVMPFSLTINQGGSVFAKMTIQEITFNGNIEDSFFKISK